MKEYTSNIDFTDSEIIDNIERVQNDINLILTNLNNSNELLKRYLNNYDKLNFSIEATTENTKHIALFCCALNDLDFFLTYDLVNLSNRDNDNLADLLNDTQHNLISFIKNAFYDVFKDDAIMNIYLNYRFTREYDIFNATRLELTCLMSSID